MQHTGFSSADEQEATDEIVNDWVADNVKLCFHHGPGVDPHYTATIMLFISVTATGKTASMAFWNLKFKLLDMPSTRHNIATEWLYTTMRHEDEPDLSF